MPVIEALPARRRVRAPGLAGAPVAEGVGELPAQAGVFLGELAVAVGGFSQPRQK
jgi:hypothetical protein